MKFSFYFRNCGFCLLKKNYLSWKGFFYIFLLSTCVRVCTCMLLFFFFRFLDMVFSSFVLLKYEDDIAKGLFRKRVNGTSQQRRKVKFDQKLFESSAFLRNEGAFCQVISTTRQTIFHIESNVFVWSKLNYSIESIRDLFSLKGRINRR